MKKDQIITGDCLIEMQKIPDKSVDMILCDLPYGTTACKWDTIIPFEPLWEQYKRIIKDGGAIVLTASQPFTSALVMSNIKMFKYEWIWEKSRPTNQMLAKKQPLKSHENILIFSKGKTIYSPKMTDGDKNHATKDNTSKQKYLDRISISPSNTSSLKYPRSVIKFKSTNAKYNLHPTQKPVDLFEYLVKTYSNEGDLVLDNCAGSGTTGVACRNLKRNFILIEKEPKYIEVIKQRLRQEILL